MNKSQFCPKCKSFEPMLGPRYVTADAIGGTTSYGEYLRYTCKECGYMTHTPCADAKRENYKTGVVAEEYQDERSRKRQRDYL